MAGVNIISFYLSMNVLKVLDTIVMLAGKQSTGPMGAVVLIWLQAGCIIVL